MPTTRTILARAMFGILAAERDPVPGVLATARAIDSTLESGHIALITGPSGAGKSTILQQLAHELRQRDHAAIIINPARLRSSTTVIDSLNAPLATTLSLLATCGLADATILEKQVRHLSAGQRWRLALAAGLRRAQLRRGHCTLLIDELGSTLDATTARCICRTLRRFIQPRPIRAVCATHDHTLMDFLSPSLLCIQPLNTPAILSTHKAPAA